MAFLDAVEIYFRGERTAGYGLIPVGALSLAAGIYLWRVHGASLAKGLGIPLLVVGIGLVIGGIVLVRTVDARQARLEASTAKDVSVPIADELARIDKVNGNWLPLKIGWAALAAISFALVFLVGRPWVHGLALSLLLISATFMVVDSFAEKRAQVYEETLQKLAPE